MWTTGRRVALVVLLALLAAGYAAVPYLQAASLIVRAANFGGRVEALATGGARTVAVRPPRTFQSRYGDVPVQFYEPAGAVRRTVLMIPGIHSMGISEPRLKTLASDLAGSGIRVVTMALPDLTRYRITPRATDTIEDGVAWLAKQPDLAPDRRIGLLGVSFSGGLSISAAAREAVRDKLAFVVSFGGHGDLPRVMRYLTTGTEASVDGLTVHPPHDYGVAVILYGLADRGVVPVEQVEPLRDAIRTFLLASQLTLVSTDRANAAFAEAREKATHLPEPARTYMNYVNDRNVKKLGPALVPFLDALGATDSALSPDRVDHAPTAPIYLLHGHEDTVIPAVESVMLSEYLRAKGTPVRLLLTPLVTHAEVDHAAAPSDVWNLVSFWAEVLKQ